MLIGFLYSLLLAVAGGLPLLLSKKPIFVMDSWISYQATAGVHLNHATSNLCVVKLAVLPENVTPFGFMCSSFVEAHMEITVLWLFWGDLCGCAKNDCVQRAGMTLPVLLKGKLTSLDELMCLEAFVSAFFWTEELCWGTWEHALERVTGGVMGTVLEWMKNKLRSLRRKFKDLSGVSLGSIQFIKGKRREAPAERQL